MFTSGSPNSGQLQIGIALVLQDRFSNQAREASSQIRRLHQDAKSVTNANLSAAQSMASMGAAAGGVLTAGIVSAVTKGAEFIDTMTFVDAIVKKNGVTIDKLKLTARSLGSDTMFDSQDIASAMKFMAQAGLDSKEIYTNIKGTANLAGATGVSIGGKGGAADILTSVMKMFNIASSEMNSNRIADVLSKVTTRSKTDLLDLSEAIRYAGSSSVSLGGSLEQTSAFMGIMADAGIRGSMAGTSVANAYRYLAKSISNPDFKGGKALAKLGLSKSDFLDASGNLIDLGSAIQKISESANRTGNIEWFNDFIEVFGVRGQRAAFTMSQSFGRYKELLSELQNDSQGSSARIMAMRMESIAGRIDIMKSNFENLQTTFTEKVAPALKPIFSAIGYLIDSVSFLLNIPFVGPLMSTLFTFGTVLITLRLAVFAFTAGLRLMFNDSTVSVRNMFSVMLGGWKGATVSASQYAAVQAGIIAQQKAGMVSNAMGAATFAATAGGAYMTANRGTYVGGVKQSPGGYFYRQNATGRATRISAAAAAATVAGKTPQQLGIIGAKVGAGGMMAAGAGGLGRGLLAAFGGPWGIAVMGIFMLLPMLISAFSKNTDETENNSSVVSKNNSLQEQKIRNAAGLTDEEQRIMVANALNNLAEAMRGGSKGGNIVINVDGKKAIEKAISGNNNEQVIGLTLQ